MDAEEAGSSSEVAPRSAPGVPDRLGGQVDRPGRSGLVSHVGRFHASQSKAVRARQKNHGIVMEITDTGHGIKPTDLENIYEAFYSTKDSSEVREECFGTGLGLAFCRLVVEAHDGHISVRSKLGQGTTFSITLPPAPAASTEA